MKNKSIKEIVLNVFSIIFIYSGILIAFDNTVIKLLTKYPDKNNLIGIIIFLIGIGLFMVFIMKIRQPPERKINLVKPSEECEDCYFYKEISNIVEKKEEGISDTKLNYLKTKFWENIFEHGGK